jgi:mRNA interferase MazF
MESEYIKDFDQWNEHAKKLNDTSFNDFFNNREIWWCSLGINIGSEQDGKNQSFERPVLIIRKINKDLLFVVPLTTKIQDYPDRVNIQHGEHYSQVLLNHAKSISSKRLLRKIGRLNRNSFRKVIIRLVMSLLHSEYNETPP